MKSIMKKILFFITLMALTAAMLCSCSNSESSPSPEESGNNYLVMFYGLGGGDLDTCIISNIIQAIDEGGNEKLNMTFEYKVSTSLQKNAECANFNGVRRFTLSDNAHLKGKFQSMSKKYPKLDKDAFAYYMKELKTEKIGGADYNMTSAESLADFIKWSKSKYPAAKRTILVLSDHGSGWNIHRDGMRGTRAILFDDNLKDKNLTAQDVVDGITNGGGVDLLYEDACLMSMYENLYTYAKAVRFLMVTQEVTADDGGDYRKLLSLLKNAGTGDAELEGAMHTYADYCTSDQWWSRKDGELLYNDLGLYDLSKLGAVTPVLQKVARTLAEKIASNESVDPQMKPSPIGDNYDAFVRWALNDVEVAYRMEEFEVDSIPKTLVPYVLKDITPTKDRDTGAAVVDGRKLIDWIKLAETENAREAYEKYGEDWQKLRWKIITSTPFSFSLTDLLRQLHNVLGSVIARNDPFGMLHDELMEALKSMAYISCSTPKDLPGVNQPYELCSPGIVIIPLNDLYNIHPLYSSVKSYEEALRYYQSCDFDKQVGWSEVLKLIDVMPSILSNPGRNDVRY